jgi:hypothetical protein
MEMKRAGDRPFGQIVGSQIKAGPDELGPNVVSDGPRVRPYQCEDALGGDHTTHRIESSRDKLPLLDVTKEHAKDGNAAGPCAGRENLAAALYVNWIYAAPVATMPLTNDRYGFGSEFSRPISRRSDLRMHLAKPSSNVEQKIVAFVPVLTQISGSVVPETAEPTPLGRHTEGQRGRQLLILDWALDLHRFRNSAHARQNSRECHHTIASSARRPARDHVL